MERPAVTTEEHAALDPSAAGRSAARLMAVIAAATADTAILETAASFIKECLDVVQTAFA